MAREVAQWIRRWLAEGIVVTRGVFRERSWGSIGASVYSDVMMPNTFEDGYRIGMCVTALGFLHNLIPHGTEVVLQFRKSIAYVEFGKFCQNGIGKVRDRHGRPWGFFGPPVPVPKKNRTRMLRRRKFTGTGTVFSQVPMFPRAFRVTGFRVTLALGYDKKNTTRYVFLILAICNKKKTSNTRFSNVSTQICPNPTQTWTA
jgi:hypothetical protein